jgi:putative Holliday junction resolvase
MLHPNNTILSLDVGARRIGVATASVAARFASPCITLAHTAEIMHDITRLTVERDAQAIVVGLPRGLDGQATQQTKVVEEFVQDLRMHTGLPIYWQDEALTSRKAEEELEARKKPYAKGDIDALAATYILEDFLQEHPEVHA